mgnify:CR=1 FL=1
MLQVIPNVHLFLFLNFKLNEQDSRDHEFSEEGYLHVGVVRVREDGVRVGVGRGSRGRH